jgi:hypothetical protein
MLAICRCPDSKAQMLAYLQNLPSKVFVHRHSSLYEYHISPQMQPNTEICLSTKPQTVMIKST